MAKEVIRQDVIEVGFNADIKSLDRFDRELSNLWDNVKKGKGDFNKFKESVEDTNESVDDIGKKSIPKFEKGLNKIGKEAAETEKKVKGLDNVFEGLSDKLSKGVEKTKSMESSFFGKISTGLAGLGIAAGTGAVIGNVNDMSKAMNQFQAKTGANVNEMQQYGDAMKEVYNNGMGESWGDVADSFAVVKTNMGLAGDELKNTANNALLLRDTFDFDVNESTRAASMMMKQFGLTGDEAYNLIAQGAQSGLDKNGDLLDTINEYSVHFKQLGFDAEDMFNMLANGTADGTFSVDKLGDSIKEFGIRVIDGSDTTKAGFAEIGLNADTMAKKFSQGGESARDAFDQTVKGLQEIKDPIAQNTAGVNLFGTMWEDLGKEGIFALSDVKGEISNTSNALENINAIKYDDAGSALLSLGRTVNTALAGAVGDAVNSARGYINDFMAGFNGENGGAFFAQIGEGMRIGIDKAKLALQDFKAGLEGADSGTFFSNVGIAAQKVGTIISKVTGFLGEHKTATKNLIVTYIGFKTAVTAVNAVLKIKSKLDKAASLMSKLQTKLIKKETTATLGETAATAAQTTATGAATAAQTGLNTAMKACPIVAVVSGVAALGAGLVLLAKKFDPLKKKLKENSDIISKNISGMKNFKTAIDDCEPSLANYSSLLSDKGNTLGDIDTNISNVEGKITSIIATALSEQRELRESDLQSIRNYNNQLKEMQNEKLGIYQAQQQSVITEARLRIDNGGFNRENAAQMASNAEEAYNSTVSAIAANLEISKANIENLFKAGSYSESEYKNELEWVQKVADQQIQEAKNKRVELLQILGQNALDVVSPDNNIYKNLTQAGKTWSDNNWTWQEAFYKDGYSTAVNKKRNSTGIYSDELKNLGTDSLESANTLLQAATDIKENGGTLSAEMQNQIKNIFAAFDNVPEECSEDAKNVILGMIGGMEEQIPELADTTQKSAEEIADTFRNYLGINSPSKVTFGMGLNIGEGLINGMEKKKSGLASTGKNLINGLISGMNSKKSSAVKTAAEIANAINKEFDKIQDINSPSKVWEEKGKYLIEGLNIGLEKGSANTQEVYKRKPILPAYKGESYTVSRNSNVTYSAPINITVNGDGSSRQTARSIKNAVKEGINEMLSSFANSNKPVRES